MNGLGLEMPTNGPLAVDYGMKMDGIIGLLSLTDIGFPQLMVYRNPVVYLTSSYTDNKPSASVHFMNNMQLVLKV